MVAVFHILFVPLTLGLSVLTAYMETRYAVSGEESFLRAAKYWGRLFLINFAVGVVTGITLEFQFGMNWARYSKFVGDIFGAPLAIEATVAFFLESTMIGLWMFGWTRLSKGLHALVIWLVAFASTLSAVWILLANGWMQHPVGYAVQGSHAVLTSFRAVLGNVYGWSKIFHTLSAAYTLASFFVMGVSAFHLIRKTETDLFKKTFRIGATFALVCSVLVIVAGDFQGRVVADYQPTKLAAMEAQWTTEKSAPFYVIEFPNPKSESNSARALKIPKGLSLLAYHDPDATVKGLEDFPASDLPPVLVVFTAFRLMVGLGFLFVLLALVAVILSYGGTLERNRWFLYVMPYAIILPYVACELGWVVAEIGRQPWIVYGLLKTANAASTAITPGDVIASLIGFIAIYSSLAVADLFLLTKYAKKIPA